MNTYVILVLIGLISGLIGGMLGGGSDVLIVPMLLYFGVTNNIKTAIGTSLAALIPPIGIFAVYQYWERKEVNISYAMIIAVVFTIVSTYSAKIGLGESQGTLKKIYGVFLIIVGIISFKY
jgi:uncharacterized membrane protein YfcA